jgi:hypothetical protein
MELFEGPLEGLSEFQGSSRRAVRDIVRGTVRPPPGGLSEGQTWVYILAFGML